MKVLIIDNYDSFVYNLVQYSGQIADEVQVRRNDEVDTEDIRRLNPDRIIISPGPGDPSKRRYFGVCSETIQTIGRDVPILGVCLGHQGIVSAFGGRIIHATNIRHGKISPIKHVGKGIFAGIENPFSATRYHSLVAEKRSLPRDLEVTAESLDDHEIMGVRHRSLPIEGIQFHPESILTSAGPHIMENFLRG